MKVERRLLGQVEFDRAWELQRELARQVTPERGFLLLLEHPPVFTLGKNANPANILDPHGIPVRRIDRGGDVTYHGPGQLVGYPLFDIRRLGVRRFVRSLEDSVLDLLSGLGIRGRRRGSCVGVWAPRGKIASIGLRVSRGISMHGFALNVSNDLVPFGYIHPCGEAGARVSSVSLELGEPFPLERAAERFRLRFAEGEIDS